MTADVERRRCRLLQWHTRAVVDNYHLEQIARPVLGLQGGQRRRQRLRRFVVGDDHADRQGGRERIRRRHRYLPPVVVADDRQS